MALGLLVGGAALAKADYTFTTSDMPGASSTQAFGINDAGQIVGAFFGPAGLAGPSQSFLLSAGGYTTLDVPGSFSSTANKINASGQIVGSYFDGSEHGFLLSGGSYTRFDAPSSVGNPLLPIIRTQALGIYASGQIVGTYTAQISLRPPIQDTEGFLLSGGKYTGIAPPFHRR
jgi:uncharacterized membrane protein